MYSAVGNIEKKKKKKMKPQHQPTQSHVSSEPEGEKNSNDEAVEGGTVQAGAEVVFILLYIPVYIYIFFFFFWGGGGGGVLTHSKRV